MEKSSKEAAKDAQAGKLESAKEKSGKGFDTPVKSTDTVKSQPVTKQDPKEISRREKPQRLRQRRERRSMDDPKKAPPKP